jgi:8-oxo-dGTP pyrophosphatase MutT (NUDIX family)
MPLKLSVAVGGFLFVDNKLLLVKRSLHEKGDPGIWEQPGGQVEEGEDPEQAVIREFKEETTLPKPELDNHQVTIEQAKPEDAEAILRLKRAAQIKAYANVEHGVSKEDRERKFTEEDVLRGIENWERGVAGEPHGGKRQTFVARLDGEVVGFTSPCWEDEQWRIGQLYVSPDFR